MYFGRIALLSFIMTFSIVFAFHLYQNSVYKLKIKYELSYFDAILNNEKLDCSKSYKNDEIYIHNSIDKKDGLNLNRTLICDSSKIEIYYYPFFSGISSSDFESFSKVIKNKIDEGEIYLEYDFREHSMNYIDSEICVNNPNNCLLIISARRKINVI